MRIPQALAFELIAYCVRKAPPGEASEDLVRAVTSAVFDLPVHEVQLRRSDDGQSTHARVVVAREDAEAFARFVPAAIALPSPSPALAEFELTVPRQASRRRAA